MKRLFIFALLLFAGSACAQTVIRPNDPLFDNGPPITAALDAQGRDFFDELLIPCTTYYVSTTIDTPRRHGGSMRGSGGCGQVLWDAAYDQQTAGGAVSRLIWNGADGGTMLRYKSVGMDMSNLMFQGRRLTAPKEIPNQKTHGPRAAVGISIPPHKSPPTGKLECSRVTIGCVDICVDIPDGIDHADWFSWQNCIFTNCHTGYQVNCSNAVLHFFDRHRFAGTVGVGFHFLQGGALYVDGVSFTNGVLLKLGRPTRNNNNFTITNLDVDAEAKTGFCPLVMDTPEWVNVTITGFMDPSAKALPPVVPDIPKGGRPNVTIQIINYPYNMTAGVAD